MVYSCGRSLALLRSRFRILSNPFWTTYHPQFIGNYAVSNFKIKYKKRYF